MLDLAAYGGPYMLAKRLSEAPKWTASHDLAFLNEWYVFSSIN